MKFDNNLRKIKIVKRIFMSISLGEKSWMTTYTAYEKIFSSIKEKLMATFGTSNDAFKAVISDVFNAPGIAGMKAQASLTQQDTREILNYPFELDNPHHRLTGTIRLDVAAARFVWMMTANNRLADIAFYEPKVRGFTDDDLTVPGSSYGMRLRQSQPGLDQVVGVIDRLRAEPNTRRAAVTIYQPWDAVRQSKDIPCAFGMMFHNRNNKLQTTVIMRSNNAWTLLPFNIFEFSMLAEVIAAEVGLDVGKISYYAGSMHIYERDSQRVAEYLSKRQIDTPAQMAPMPRDPSPLGELTKLGKFEVELRHGSAAIDENNIDEWIKRITSEVTPYWAQIGLLLLSSVAASKSQGTLDKVMRRLDKTYRPFAPTAKSSTIPTRRDHGPLFGSLSEEKQVVVITRSPLARRFAELAMAHERAHGPIGTERLLQAQSQIFDRLAARGEGEALTLETFQSVLASIPQ